MIDSARQRRRGPAIAAFAPFRCSARPSARAPARPRRLAIALLALSLLQACGPPMPKTDRPDQPSAVSALFCSRPDRRTAFPPGRPITASTESPLSLWLYLTAADAPGPALSSMKVDLSVVDLQGQPTSGAVVQPRHFDGSSKGRAQPIAFLAKAPGDYRIRASFDAGACSSDSPRIVVSGAAVR